MALVVALVSVAALACVAALSCWAALAGPTFAAYGTPRPSRAQGPSALVAFVDAGPVARLVSIPSLSVAIESATQGSYTIAQALLDITQGTRVSASAYSPSTPPALTVTRAGQVSPWGAVMARARGAPQLLTPGLLASQVPGGAAYAGIDGQSPVDGVLAAGRDGRAAAMSIGPAATLPRRAEQLSTRHRLLVADLPGGSAGYADLRALLGSRPSGELVVVLQRASPAHGHELLWAGFAGLGPGGDTLTSQTTDQRGLIAAIDLAPTILGHLGIAPPAEMRGKPVRLDGRFDESYLSGLKARLGVIGDRRLPALGWLVVGWVLLVGGARLADGARLMGRARPNGAQLMDGARLMSGARPKGAPERRPRPRQAWALRVGALALLWAPAGSLITAVFEPGRAVEFVLLTVACFSLAALTDRLVGWPRGPLVPALVTVGAIVVDALAGTQLLIRSLIGPNPAFGARFYGIGNELKSGLAVLVLCAVAAALYPAVRGRRAALAMILAGIGLAVVEGAARIGAGVGGVILVSAGTAMAAALLLPGSLTRRRAVWVMVAPALGLIGLAALDLTTAHGSGHFTGSVLHARSPADVRDILVRRYSAAWDELGNHLMPLATALALAAGLIGVHRRERLTTPVNGDPAWIAGLCGGLTAGIVGALSEDSGPVLLVVAVGALACMVAYLWGAPAIHNSFTKQLGRSD